MPPKVRDYKKEYQQQLDRPYEKKRRHDRYEARKLVDEMGIDRKGKDVAHVKALANGGKTTKSNIKVESVHANRSYARKHNHEPKK